MFSFYSRLLDRYPFLTKSITAGLLFSFADTITQKCRSFIIKALKKNKSSITDAISTWL